MSLPDFAALDLLPAQIALLDETGAIIGTNRAWNDMAKRGCLDQGRKSWNYLGECQAAARRGCVEAGKIADGINLVLGGAEGSYSCTYPCALDGRHHWYQATISAAGESFPLRAVVMHVDVTALEHDALTGLANRVLFDAQADLSLRTAAAESSATGVLLIDLNRFKPVNDRYGHLAGDHVLRSVATRLQACVRRADVAARFGGDEFGVVLAPGTGPAVAERMMRRIQAAIEQSIPFGEQALAVGLSIGAGMFPADGATVAELVAAADSRMYGMKRRRLIA